MQRYAILLADVVAKRPKKRCCCCTNKFNVSKGELLVEVVASAGHAEEDASLQDYHLATSKGDSAIVSADSEVAALTDREFALLQAIEKRRTRYGVHQSGKCSWGAGLKVNDSVNVSLSKPDVQVYAAIRYIGQIRGYNGTMFGVEIVVSPHVVIYTNISSM